MAYLPDHSFEDVQTKSEVNSQSWIVPAEPANFEIHIDQDGHRGRTTPIARLYLREIMCAMAGDKLIILQKNIPACENNTIWLSYYQALPDREIGQPVLMKLRNLRNKGCTVRVLLDANRMNAAAYKALKELDVEVKWARFPTGTATLGHKLVVAKTGDQTLVIQSSANLSASHHLLKHNLTLSLQGRFFFIHQPLEDEIRRYWNG